MTQEPKINPAKVGLLKLANSLGIVS